MRAKPHSERRHSGVTLWVEDPLTRRSLDEFWGDSDLRPQVAYGLHGVRQHVSHRVEGDPPGAPIGLVDRDFGVDNTQRWSDPTFEGVLVIDAHEFENLLLDFDAIARLMRGVSRDDAASRARAFAGSMVPWMACRHVLHDIRQIVQQNQISDPPCLPSRDAPHDEQAAVRHIVTSKYLPDLRRRLERDLSDGDVRDRVAAHATAYRGDLDSGEWLRTFSGKELLRHLRDEFSASMPAEPGLTQTQRDEDFAVRIARSMRAHGSGSHGAKTLTRLRDSLRMRLRPR